MSLVLMVLLALTQLPESRLFFSRRSPAEMISWRKVSCMGVFRVPHSDSLDTKERWAWVFSTV